MSSTLPAQDSSENETVNKVISKGQKTATRVLDAAEALFADKGFAGTSLRDIAGAAGIQKASLYNHFSSKDELYNEVLKRGFEPMLAVMNDFMARGEQAYENPQLTSTFFEMMASMPNFARLLQFESLQGGERLKSLMEQWVSQGLLQGEQAMKGSSHGKHWREDEYRMLIFYTFTMILGYFTLGPIYELYTGDESMTDESVNRQKHFLGKLWHQLWYVPKS